MATISWTPTLAATTSLEDSNFGDHGVVLSSSPLGGGIAVGYGLALDAQGHPKADFGEGGVYPAPVAAGGLEERLFALQTDSSGRPIAAGFSRDSSGTMWLVVRRLAQH